MKSSMFVGKFNKSCLITYIGITFGVFAMYFAFIKLAFSDTDYVRYSLICLMIAGICDMFDGKFARSCKRTKEEKEFGVQLDSLADTFCFLAVPVVIMLALRLYSPLCLMVYIYFIISGVTRLGYFNINAADSENAIKVYNGLPVTSTAIIFPVLGLLHTVVSVNIFGIIFVIATAIIGFLFNFKIRIPKFKGKAYVIVPILALILLILLLVF